MNNEARELLRLRAYLNTTLAASTGHSVDKVAKDISRERFFNADTAVEYGLIDRINYPRRTQIAA